MHGSMNITYRLNIIIFIAVVIKLCVWYSSKKVSKQRPAPRIGQQYAEVSFFSCFEHTTYFLCCFDHSVLGATFPRKFLQSAMELYYGTRVVPVHSPPDVSSRFTPLPTCRPGSLPSRRVFLVHSPRPHHVNISPTKVQ